MRPWEGWDVGTWARGSSFNLKYLNPIPSKKNADFQTYKYIINKEKCKPMYFMHVEENFHESDSSMC
jgi:hypothetical protein